jgi:hypothetical protein
MIVTGANINFDTGSGQYMNMMDAGMIKAWADQGIVDQGLVDMEYITAPIPGYTRSKG